MDNTHRAYKVKDTEKNQFESIISTIEAQFPFQRPAITNLLRNIPLGINTFLYSKGGYGKSQLIKAVCEELKLKPIIVSCNRDTSLGQLIGMINMEKFLKKAEYEQNFNSSPFMNEGVLVLEELTDVDPAIVVSLKDILQEKGYRDKDTFIPFKVQAVIAVGNQNPANFAVDNSSAALYNERFPVHINMDWIEHDPNNYLTLFKSQSIENEYAPVIAQLSSKVEASPRAALNAMTMITHYPSEWREILLNMVAFKSLELDFLQTLTLYNE